MAYINENYLKLQAGYLFPEIGRRVNEFSKANPNAASRLIRCGIGDVTEPLPKACIEALHSAVDEIARLTAGTALGNVAALLLPVCCPSSAAAAAAAAAAVVLVASIEEALWLFVTLGL